MECNFCGCRLVKIEDGVAMCLNDDCMADEQFVEVDTTAAEARTELLPFTEVTPNDSDTETS